MDTYQNAGCNGIIVTIDQQASYYERTQQDRNFGGRVAPCRQRLAWAPEVQHLPVRHGTGSTVAGYGTRGNISMMCARWSKVRW